MTEQEEYEIHRAELQAYFSAHQDQIDVAFGNLSRCINDWMGTQGFWESSNLGEKIALMHSELSECLEAIRKGDEENEEEELADCIIRILDYAGHRNMNLGAALCEKMRKNLLRPRKHGKAF